MRKNDRMGLNSDYHNMMHERIYRYAPTRAKAHHTWAVLSAICCHLNLKTHECTKTVPQLCELTLSSQSDMSDILGLLENIGAIRRIKHGDADLICVTPVGSGPADREKLQMK